MESFYTSIRAVTSSYSLWDQESEGISDLCIFSSTNKSDWTNKLYVVPTISKVYVLAETFIPASKIHFF